MARSVPARLRGVALVVLVLGLLAVLAAPAQAAPPVPPRPPFGAAIDDYAPSEAEDGCRPEVQSGILALRDRVLRPAYGGSFGDYGTKRACGGRTSGHKEGRSLDWMMDARVPAEYANARAFLDWLLAPDEHGNPNAMARRLGVMYVLYNNQMWRSYRANEGWLPQSYEGVGCAEQGPAYATVCHRDHIHLSLSWQGALQRTSFWSGAATATPAAGVVSCPTPPKLSAPAAPGAAGLTYLPLAQPVRILDTRSGLGTSGACRLGPAGRVDLQVTGRGGVPARGVGAVVLNLVGLYPTESTSLAAYPAGLRYPGTNTLTLRAGSLRSAAVVLPVGTSGRVSLLNAVGRLDLAAEVLGYYPTEVVPGSLAYHPVKPTRMWDYRTGSTAEAGRPRAVAVTGGRVPASARAVAVEVHVLEARRSGSVSVVAAGALPSTVTLAFGADRPASNRALVPLSADGRLDVHVPVDTRIALDVVGWFGDAALPGGALFVPLSPRRILDSRSGYGLPARLGSRAVRVQVAGRGGVPADGARAVEMTLTGWQVGAATELTTAAGTTDVQLNAGEPAANLVLPRVRADGTVPLSNRHGRVHVLGDVLGYYR